MKAQCECCHALLFLQHSSTLINQAIPTSTHQSCQPAPSSREHRDCDTHRHRNLNVKPTTQDVLAFLFIPFISPLGPQASWESLTLKFNNHCAALISVALYFVLFPAALISAGVEDPDRGGGDETVDL